jgi:hypothetical protein
MELVTIPTDPAVWIFQFLLAPSEKSQKRKGVLRPGFFPCQVRVLWPCMNAGMAPWSAS